MLIKNYKSIKKAELEFSKINVLVGPNGSGKHLFWNVPRF
ncbi:AAA family ATPase [Thermococcus sibiricus]